MRGSAKSYRVFVRNWWRFELGKLVPNPGARRTTLHTNCTEEEAREHCADYANKHEPGPLSRKAEFEEE